MQSNELTFGDETTPMLIAGRAFSGTASWAQLEALGNAADALGTKLGLRIVAVAEGDRSTGSGDDSSDYASGVIGILIATGDANSPTAVGYSGIRALLDKAASLPWDELAQLLPDDELRASLEDGPKVYGVATGPLAGVKIAFGVTVGEDDEAPASEVPGLETVAGQDMDQSRNSEGVYGVRVASAHYDDGAIAEPDMSAEAHAKRVAALGSLAKDASYYLMGHYD